ncbi:retrovirus-related pol polyprotein from transposon TNT 1-94, partial [Tanacetum coccineum]
MKSLWTAVDTPMVEKSKLDEDTQGKAVDPTHYHGMVGTLMYLTSKSFKYPQEDVKLWTKGIPKDYAKLNSFADADHAGCQDTRRSTSGMTMFQHSQINANDSDNLTLIKDNDNGVIELYFVQKRNIRRIMSSITAQQTNLELVPKEKRLEIGKCNGRLNPGKKQREPTFQVILDALALMRCYSAFLITADVLEVYMHQLWDSIHKYENSYMFKMDKKKKFDLNLEIFRDIFQICPRVYGQNLDELPTDEDIMSF